MSRKYRRTGIVFLSLVPLVAGASLVCLSKCQGGSNWTEYFDDPGPDVRHQTAAGVGQFVDYTFNLKEAVPTGQKVIGDVKVVRYSHDGVNATVTDFEINENEQTATFSATIDQVPTSNSNESTTYWADIEAEVICEMTDGDQTVWTTTIEDMRVQVDVEQKALTIEGGPQEPIIIKPNSQGSDNHPFKVMFAGGEVTPESIYIKEPVVGVSINGSNCIAWSNVAVGLHTFHVEATYNDGQDTYTAMSNVITLDVQQAEIKGPSKLFSLPSEGQSTEKYQFLVNGADVTKSTAWTIDSTEKIYSINSDGNLVWGTPTTFDPFVDHLTIHASYTDSVSDKTYQADYSVDMQFYLAGIKTGDGKWVINFESGVAGSQTFELQVQLDEKPMFTIPSSMKLLYYDHPLELPKGWSFGSEDNKIWTLAWTESADAPTFTDFSPWASGAAESGYEEIKDIHVTIQVK